MALPAAVHADGFRSYRVCGGDQFATCAAVNISVVGSNVTVRLWNLSGNAAGTWGHGAGTYAGTVFNGIGFYNTTGASAVLGSLSVNGPAMAGLSPIVLSEEVTAMLIRHLRHAATLLPVAKGAEVARQWLLALERACGDMSGIGDIVGGSGVLFASSRFVPAREAAMRAVAISMSIAPAAASSRSTA